MNKQVTIFIWKLLFVFYIQPGQISVKRFFQMIIWAVLNETTVQRPKTLFVCLLDINTFLIASFWFFVQWTDLGSNNPLQLAHSRYHDTKIWGGSLDFNVSSIYYQSQQQFTEFKDMSQIYSFYLFLKVLYKIVKNCELAFFQRLLMPGHSRKR